MNDLWNKSKYSRALASPKRTSSITSSSSYQKTNKDTKISKSEEERNLIPSYNTISNKLNGGNGSWDDDDNNTINSNEKNNNYSSSMMTPTSSVRMMKRKKRFNLFQSIIFYRIIILLIVVLIILFSIRYMNHIMNELKEQLINEQISINQLNEILKQHEIVIKRFNNSISNQDVLDLVTELKLNIENTTIALYNALNETTYNINEQLNITETHLQNTIIDAENEIHNQVIQVKKDVDQYVIQTQDQFSIENSFMIYQLAGTFTLLSCLISMYHMTSHIRRLNQPEIQRKILAILWMSPIYAITSWFSLVFPKAEGYLAIIKDGYEGYVIYTFLSFCIAVIGKGDRSIVVSVLAKYGDHLSPPYRLCSCLEICGFCPSPSYVNNQTQLADDVLYQCQLFAMQFVFLRPLTTTAIVVLKKFNYYKHTNTTINADGSMNNHGNFFNNLSPQFYIMLIQNISIFVAFSGLLKFYHAVDKELAWCKPFAKFICIKGVVFMTFWQGLAISLLAQTTGNTDDNGNTNTNAIIDGKAEEWAKSAQNFLICLEMLLFSVAHFYCFPTDEWEDGYRVKHSVSNFSDTVALGDFVADIKLLLSSSNSTSNSTSKKNSKRSSKKLLTLQPSIPEENTIDTDDDDESDAASYVSSVLDDEENGGGQLHSSIHMNEENMSLISSLDDTNDHNNNNNKKNKNKQRKSIGKLKFDNYSEQQKFIAAALEETLGSIIYDPDIAQAKERLLASRLLSPNLFDYHNNNHDNDNDHDTDVIQYDDDHIQRYIDHLDDNDEYYSLPRHLQNNDSNHNKKDSQDNKIHCKSQYDDDMINNNTQICNTTLVDSDKCRKENDNMALPSSMYVVVDDNKNNNDDDDVITEMNSSEIDSCSKDYNECDNNNNNDKDPNNRFIADALKETLGSMIFDPEIAKEKDQLLASHLLSPDFFDYHNNDDIANQYDDDRIQQFIDHLDDDNDYHNPPRHVSLQNNNKNDMNDKDDDEDNNIQRELQNDDNIDINNQICNTDLVSSDECIDKDNNLALSSVHVDDDDAIAEMNSSEIDSRRKGDQNDVYNDNVEDENRTSNNDIVVTTNAESIEQVSYHPNPFDDDIPLSMTNDLSLISSPINVVDDRTTISKQHDNDDNGTDFLTKHETSEFSEVKRPIVLTTIDSITDIDRHQLGKDEQTNFS